MPSIEYPDEPTTWLITESWWRRLLNPRKWFRRRKPLVIPPVDDTDADMWPSQGTRAVLVVDDEAYDVEIAPEEQA